jgi:hypothetical protein
MKPVKRFIFIFGFTAFFSFSFFSLPIGATEFNFKNLSGITNVRIQCQFNGIPYFKGFKNVQALKTEEYNMKEIETKLKDDGVPITNENIRAIYSKMESSLIKEGVRILEIRPDSSEGAPGSTIIPSVSVNVDVIKGPQESYFVLVWIEVEKWMSFWVGDKNILSPMIIWRQKKMLSVDSKGLYKSIDSASNELTGLFLSQLKSANAPVEEKKVEKKEEKKTKKNK